MTRRRLVLCSVAAASLGITSCGSAGDPPAEAEVTAPTDPVLEPAAGVRVVSPIDAAATIADPPPGLVVLDVRTPEEFGEGHIDGAVLLDFYEPDFAQRLADLDRDVPYVLYCRSGNRSGQAREMMEALGFTTVDDVDGGILSWHAAGLPVTAG